MKFPLFLLTVFSAYLLADSGPSAEYTLNLILEILLFAAIILLVLLAYKIRLLKNERDTAQTEQEADSKILFLKSRYASMGETVGNIAHQWKQPLNAIGTIQTGIKAALIYQGEISKEKLLSSVETSFQLLRHLAETIDTFYSFLAHQETSNFFISDELEKIRKITEYSFENSRIQLIFELDTNPMILGNSNEFTHAMLNLILNAKDAFDTEHIDHPAITVRVSDGDNICHITVSDNAGGIRIEPLEMVFDWHITTKEHGSGLGLFMTKKIIEQRFGGNISVENRDGGACFTIELPYTEYGEHFNDPVAQDEKLSLERINQLSRKIIELEELEKTLKKWADIFKHAQWGIVVGTVEDLSLGQMNPEFARMHGYTIQELSGKSIESVFAPECIDGLQSAIQTANEKGYCSFESVHIRKDGSRFPVTIELMAIKDEQGSVQYRLANVWDLSEKKAAQERLLLKKFALDHIKDAVFMVDENARFHYVNQGACNALGYTHEEFEDMNVGDIDPDWPSERWSEHWNLLKELGSMTMELQHRRKDGTVFPVEVSANYIKFGDKHYNMAIVRDITERRLLEEEKENRRIRSITENSPDIIVRFDTQGRRTYLNPKAEELFSIDKSLLTGKTLSDITPVINKEFFDANLQNVIQTGEEASFETAYINAAGENGWADMRMVPEFGRDGTISSVLSIGRDITERKKMEESLAIREQELRALAESSPGMMGAYYMRPDGSVCMPYASPNIRELFGITPEEIKEDATPLMALSHPDDADMILQTIRESAHSMSLWHIEYRIIHPTKGIRWMEGNTMPYPHPNGGVIWYGYVHDITERKETEETVRLLQHSLEFSLESLFIMDADTRELKFVQVNDTACKTLGYSKEEMLCGMGVVDIDPDHNVDVLNAHVNELKKGQSLTFETRHKDKNGRIYPVEIRSSYFEYGDKKYILSLTIDITERKHSEEALKKALEFNEGIIAAIPDLLFEISHDGTYVGVWAQNEELLAAQREMLLGKKIQDILPPDAAATSYAAMREVDEKGFSVGKTFSLDLLNGKRWFELSISKKRTSGNYIALSRDITGRKELEALLDKERKFLIDAQHVAHTGSWYLDIPNGMLTWSDETYRIFELEKEGINDLHKTFYECVHPEDREMVNAPYLESLKTGLPYEIEHRIVMKDGRIKYVIERCEHTYGHDGTPLYSIGTVQDITERKLLEKEIEDAYLFLNQIVDSIHDPIFVKDKEHRWILLNQAFCTLIGQPREMLIGKSDYDFFPKEQADVFWEKDEAVYLSGNINVNEEFFTSGDGVTHCIETVKSMFVSTNEDKYLVGTIRDITERKHSEETIKNLNTTLEKRVMERTAQLQEAITKLHKEIMERIDAEKQLKLVDSAVNSTSEAIYISDKDLSILYVNDGACRMLGYTREELTSMKIADIDASFTEDQICELRDVTTHVRQTFFETRHRTKNGEIIDVEIVGNPFVYEGIDAVISVVKEITEKKAAQMELLEREEKFRQLFVLSPAAISITSLERNMYLEINDSFLDLTGYTREEVVGHSSADLGIFVNPQERAELFRIIADDGIVHDFRYHYRSKNGDINYAAAYGSVIMYKGEKCYIGHSYDMSSYEQIESMRQERLALEERLSKIAASVPGVNYIFEKNAEGIIRFTYLAPTFEELFGLSADAAMEDFSILMEHIHPDDREMIRQSIVDTARDLTNWNEEFRILHPQKEIVWIEGQSSPELQDDGSILWYGFFHDATERKNAEAALARSEETFRAMVENSPDVIIRYDLQCRRTYINPRGQMLMGKPLEEILGKTPSEYSPLPESAEFEKQFARVVSEGKEIDLESPYRTSDGEVRWGSQRIVPEFNADGQVASVMVIGRDITDGKKSEYAFKESEQRYREIFENTSDIIYLLEVVDEDHYRYLALNPAFEKAAGISGELLIGRFAGENSTQESARIMNDRYRHCVTVADQVTGISEIDIIPSGRKKFRYTLIPLLNDNGKVGRIIVMAKNITDEMIG